ncbi:tol-pal system-associated acyl-CoA thioesterase [Sutterella sp.]|uniref:tol-pal system-associated acyl-CoA thioesterase n=1 Tax=Sutterella sp. TaxID=1981025 RepID=UPI0026E01DB7|nr:tol-pal system-associated acyl-CoA thioesterase [Sutterella sp.]MDO5530810.1 tol-pal system-associated acyl-CoA thioesterase [Sutterella sp.]
MARFPVEVYWEDTDAGGIVYHSNYLKYMERARSDLMRKLNVSQAAALTDPNGYLFVAASVTIRYRRAAKLDDRLTVVTRVTALRRASIVFEQNVMRGDELITEGEVRVGCVSRSTMSPAAMPDELYERIRALLDAAAAESES